MSDALSLEPKFEELISPYEIELSQEDNENYDDDNLDQEKNKFELINENEFESFFGIENDENESIEETKETGRMLEEVNETEGVTGKWKVEKMSGLGYYLASYRDCISLDISLTHSNLLQLNDRRKLSNEHEFV